MLEIRWLPSSRCGDGPEFCFLQLFSIHLELFHCAVSTTPDRREEVDFGIGFQLLEEAAAAHGSINGHSQPRAEFVAVAQTLPDAGKLYLEEIDGLSDGSGVDFDSILPFRERTQLMRDVEYGHVVLNGGRRVEGVRGMRERILIRQSVGRTVIHPRNEESGTRFG